VPHTAIAPPEPAPAAAPAVDTTEALTRAIARRDEAFCLDVVQDAMLKVGKRVPTLANEAALSAWLCRVVHRAALDRLRAERRRVARERHGHHGGSASETDERIEWLRGRLRELSAADRGLLAARFARGRTLEQAGEEVGLTGDAAHGRVRRILRGLGRTEIDGIEEKRS
jgi:RNA polymerase sigma factor (sigma-70 family)